MSIPTHRHPVVIDGDAAPLPTTQRLFIGLLPDDLTQVGLERHRRAWGLEPESSPTGLSPLHLTLHFLGDVPVERIAALQGALAEVAVTGMRLVLRAPALWKVAVLRPDENEALQDLRRRLAVTLSRLGLHVEPSWTPHVTLVRDAGGLTPPRVSPDPVAWFAQGFSLIRSHVAPGVRRPHYEVLACYPAASRGQIPGVDAASACR